MNDVETPVGTPVALSDTDCTGPETVRVAVSEVPIPAVPDVEVVASRTLDALKEAVIEEGLFTVTVVGFVMPVTAPLQPANEFPDDGTACRVTDAPAAK